MSQMLISKVSCNNKIVLNTSVNLLIRKNLLESSAKKIYFYNPSNLEENSSNAKKNINIINLTDCKKYIKTCDVILFDLNICQRKDEDCLKQILGLILKNRVKPGLELIAVNSIQQIEPEKIAYRNLINDFVASLVKLKGLKYFEFNVFKNFKSNPSVANKLIQ